MALLGVAGTRRTTMRTGKTLGPRAVGQFLRGLAHVSLCDVTTSHILIPEIRAPAPRQHHLAALVPDRRPGEPAEAVARPHQLVLGGPGAARRRTRRGPQADQQRVEARCLGADARHGGTGDAGTESTGEAADDERGEARPSTTIRAISASR